ncbi:uncharacterized protein N7500_001100 [Penicillium coprophilum]|uniref:uncharacterized protein n=1 Tax=Penicillium coprophilum TaxID=36646 RepID=UPI0023A63B84|nr:uncharacterized protein N7500_001100 [Penicillium coprophilum]KAJ5178401.1 hypothetical protein N7500_001100 [Penicillium coprophilum]
MYPILPGVNAWNFYNIPNPHKRAMAIGCLICSGNESGIIGSYIYKDEERPRYSTGDAKALHLRSLLLELNKKNAMMTVSEIEGKYTEDHFHKMEERSPLFKYNL